MLLYAYQVKATEGIETMKSKDYKNYLIERLKTAKENMDAEENEYMKYYYAGKVTSLENALYEFEYIFKMDLNG